MKITRRQLQRLILQEVRRLNEGAMLSPEASAYISKTGRIDYDSLPRDENGECVITLGRVDLGGMEYTTLTPSMQRLDYPLVKSMHARALVTDIPRKLNDGSNNPDWSEGSGAA